MGSYDIHTLFHRLLADSAQNNSLIHPCGIYLISGFQLLLVTNQCSQISEAFLLYQIHNCICTFSFCLGMIQKVHIFFCILFHFIQSLITILFPAILTFHLTTIPFFIRTNACSVCCRHSYYCLSSIPSASNPLSIFFIAPVTSPSSNVLSFALNVIE